MWIKNSLKSEMNEIVSFARNMYLTSLSMIPTKELDVNVLGWVTTMEVVGVYKIAKNFLAALWSFVDSVSLVCYPKIAELVHKKENRELQHFVILIRKVMLSVGVVLFLAGYIVVPMAIELLFDSNSDISGALFQIMSLGILIWAPFVWLNPLVLASGKADIMARSALLTALFLIILYPLAIVFYGGYGGAVITALSSPLTILFIYIPANRALNVSSLFKL
jgi:O-antigen/teichoic acid export membrane protein